MKTSSNTRSANSTSATIYDLLIADHRAVIALLDQAISASGKERRGLIDTIVDELTAHATAEEALFYAPLADAQDAKDKIGEANEEHLSTARLMSDLLDPTYTDDRIAAKLNVLKEQLEHHIEEEEEELFALGRRHFDAQTAEAMGGEFTAQKQVLMAMPLMVRVQEAIAKQMVESRAPDGVMGTVKKVAKKAAAAAMEALDPR